MYSGRIRCLNPAGFHDMHFTSWGNPDNDRVVICVHGLARNCRDFDALAKALSRDYRVVCPDIVGRGKSDWLPQGQAYGMPQYLNDMTALIAHLGADKVDWIGTSMGGIIGMLIASLPNNPIKHLVLNDIGGFVPSAALKRIVDYLQPRTFANLAEAEQYMRDTYLAYQGLDDNQWLHLAKQGVRQSAETGLYEMHYDPAIVESTQQVSHEDVNLWPAWNNINIPQLLIWGEQSDVLQANTVRQMQANPQLTLVALANMGHAPSLMEADQIQKIQAWLRHNRKS